MRCGRFRNSSLDPIVEEPLIYSFVLNFIDLSAIRIDWCNILMTFWQLEADLRVQKPKVVVVASLRIPGKNWVST